MRIGLFDWTTGGHHSVYSRWIADALSSSSTDVVLAVPDDDPAAREGWSLGAARPELDPSRPLGPQHRELAERELDLFTAFVGAVEPDHVVHLYADPILRRMVSRPSFRCPISICVFFPRAHYPSTYGSPLSPKERMRALFLEWLVARWRRRPDAHALFTLDDAAVSRWNARRGCRAFYLPEPPVAATVRPPSERIGCVVYGTLAARKGIHLVAAALEGSGVPVTLAGAIEPSYRPELERIANKLSSGTRVILRTQPHDEAQALTILAGARCVLLPYVRHYTRSRVLLEAAVAGTPAIAHEDGYLGHIVRHFGLGITVDCTDSAALRRAVLGFVDGVDRTDYYAANLAHYAALHSIPAFTKAVLAPFGSPTRPQALTPLDSARVPRERAQGAA